MARRSRAKTQQARRHRVRTGPAFERLEAKLALATVTMTEPSRDSGDGTYDVEQRDGVDVYVATSNFLYYDINTALLPGFTPGDTLYLRVSYYDEGLGRLRAEYDSFTDNSDLTEVHARSSALDTLEFVSSYHVMPDAQFANGTAGGNDLRVRPDGAPVASISVSDEPFAGSGLEWYDDPPWLAPYDGPSRPVDASTLDGKIVVGYQGWFNTPNDVEDSGYSHWGEPGDWHVDQWPDPNDYDPEELFAVPGVTTASGEQAYLFSSVEGSVVHRHFQWMREHDIDGAFVQRFQSRFAELTAGREYDGPVQWQLISARDAAHLEGRTWAVEYDIQNAGDEAARDVMIERVKNDWEYLTDVGGLDLLNDTHYQRHDGKPVVAIFGLYLNSGNLYTTAQQEELVHWFKDRGVYVVGAGRHQNEPTQVANAGLHDAYIPWQGYWNGGNSYTPAENTLSGVVDHIPHVFPGFSWTHLQDDGTLTPTDREDGEFYWRMLADAVNETAAEWLFIGMFDEYDEATNLIPASDDPPVPDTDALGNPLTFQTSDPAPNDWWMALTGAAKQALQGKTTINDTIPTEGELENRSNVGGEASWTAAVNDRLEIVSTANGAYATTPFTVDGQSFDAATLLDDYLYFQVDDAFLSATGDGRDVTIEVEYRDAGLGQFSLQYGAPGDAYRASGAALLTGSGEWRTHRFELADADLANGQNSAADFRVTNLGGGLNVRSVRVIKESALTVDADLGAVDVFNGLALVTPGDGQTTAASVGGRDARLVTGSGSSQYLYLDIDDAFAYEVEAGLNAVVEIVYQDVGSGTLSVQYDAIGDAYRTSDTVVTLDNSGEWRTARFYVDDAYFGGGQNAGADFRVLGDNVPVDAVRVLRSFGDLIAPEAVYLTSTPDTAASEVTVSWAVTDDWRTGVEDQWTTQEDNRAVIEWTDDGGATWNALAVVRESGGSISGYDPGSGLSSWFDSFTWDVSGEAPGTYQVRVTPIDGRGNVGEALVSTGFTVTPALPGDYNLDGVVNSLDYLVYRETLTETVDPFAGADGNGDGEINGSDYAVWAPQYGATNTASANSSSLADSTATASPQAGFAGFESAFAQIAEEDDAPVVVASVRASAPATPGDDLLLLLADRRAAEDSGPREARDWGPRARGERAADEAFADEGIAPRVTRLARRG